MYRCFFVVLCIVVIQLEQSFVSSKVLEDVLLCDCNGRFTIFPWIPLGKGIIDFGQQKSVYDWIVSRLYTRFSCATTSSITLNNFTATHNYLSVDYWINFLQGKNALAPVMPDILPPLIPKTQVTFHPFADGGCTLDLYRSSAGCALTMKNFFGLSADLILVLKKCPASAFPYIHLSCSGKSCDTLGKFCTSLTDCSSGEQCQNISAANIDDLNAALQSMRLYNSSTDSQCDNGPKFFQNLINFALDKIWQVTTPSFTWNTPPHLGMCTPSIQDPQKAFSYSYTTTNTSDGTTVIDVTLPELQPYTGTLNGDVFDIALSDPNSIPLYATESTNANAPKFGITLLYHMANEVGIGNLCKGLPAIGLAILNELLYANTPTPSPTPNGVNPSPYSQVEITHTSLMPSAIMTAISFAGTFRGKAPGIDILTNYFFNTIYALENCRAAGSLSVAAFKARFGWPMDYLFENFFYPAPEIDLGPLFSDWTVKLDSKILMPPSCTYDSWIGGSRTCGAEYIGFQSVLNMEISIRAIMKWRSDYLIPEATLDCDGSACKLLSTITPCATDNDCSGIHNSVCYDPMAKLPNDFDPIPSVLTAMGSHNPNTACFGKAKFDQDVADLFQWLTKNTFTSSKFCFVDIPALQARITKPSITFNMTKWLNEQTSAVGSVISFEYLKKWNPIVYQAPQPTTTGKCKFIVIVHDKTLKEDGVKNMIITLLVKNNYNPDLFTIIVKFQQKRQTTGTNAIVELTSIDPTQTTSVASSLKDSSSSLSHDMTANLGTVSADSITTEVVPYDKGNGVGGFHERGFIQVAMVVLMVLCVYLLG